jgi:CheY-like chemotaxis protein
MDITDSTTLGQFAVNRGLITPEQLAVAMEDAQTSTGKTTPDLIFFKQSLERKGFLTNFQTSKLLKGDPDGYFMGGYRILYKVSSGSFGRVFRADDPTTGRVVAVKVLRRLWSEDQQRIDLFVREGRVGLTLQHPNIVEVLAINQEPSSRQYYIAMEFVEGGNLREILAIHKTLPVDRALSVIDDCANGLAYAYSRGITHRDMKLTNILISTSGEAKLVDFGLAQMFASISREEEHVDRTVDYAGLEKTTGVKQGDVRSDIFFLGCVFYECLTGKPPLAPTKDRHMRMSRRRFEECLQLKPGDVKAPPAVFTLCETMLSLDPNRRYQTPSQLVEAIKSARRDVAAWAGVGDDGKPVTRTIFVAEAHEGLREAMREKFKGLGYRVFLAGDPERALDRFRQHPYDALIVDVGTTGEDGLLVFQQVMTEALNKGARVAGVAIFNEDQAEMATRLSRTPRAAAFVRPVTLKQVHKKLLQLFTA